MEQQGLNLLPELTDPGAQSDPLRPVFFQRRKHRPGKSRGISVAGEKYGVRVGDWKLILGPQEETRELYHLRDDPGETKNRFVDDPEVAAQLSDVIARWQRDHGSAREASEAISQEDAEKLRALGYVE